MTTISTKAGESAPPKKPYETPRLEVYGDVREIAERGPRRYARRIPLSEDSIA